MKNKNILPFIPSLFTFLTVLARVAYVVCFFSLPLRADTAQASIWETR